MDSVSFKWITIDAVEPFGFVTAPIQSPVKGSRGAETVFVETTIVGGIGIGLVQAVRTQSNKRVVRIRICQDYNEAQIKNPPPIGGEMPKPSYRGVKEDLTLVPGLLLVCDYAPLIFEKYA